MVRTYVVLAVVLLWVAIGGAIPAPNIPKVSEEKTMATCSPDSVLQHIFVLLQSGRSEEAEGLFLIRNPDQRRVVQDFISRGIAAIASEQITIRVVETFENGRFAVCAIEQTSTNLPGIFELEKGFLIFEGNIWRLLPQPQDYRAKINGFSPQEISEFDILDKEFSSFKRGYKKDLDPEDGGIPEKP